jgi:hypothetical protein
VQHERWWMGVYEKKWCSCRGIIYMLEWSEKPRSGISWMGWNSFWLIFFLATLDTIFFGETPTYHPSSYQPTYLSHSAHPSFVLALPSVANAWKPMAPTFGVARLWVSRAWEEWGEKRGGACWSAKEELGTSKWEELGVLRWKELCKEWRKAQLQSKLLSTLFFHCIVIVYCLVSAVARRGQWHRNILVLLCFCFLGCSFVHNVKKKRTNAFKCIIVIYCFAIV